jgi:hypothetical protein
MNGQNTTTKEKKSTNKTTWEVQAVTGVPAKDGCEK